MKHKKSNIIQVRDDVFVPLDNIDIIIKTKTNPKDNSTLKDYIYVIYLKNSKFQWISVDITDYNKYLKKYYSFN